MIYPIYAYGHAVLRKRAAEIRPDHPELKAIIANMYETMYHAEGVGLAAPQVGLSIRLFVVDGAPMDGMLEDDEPLTDFKHVFINPVVVEEDGEEWGFREGCLSIPGIREEVFRPERVLLRWQDETFATHEAWFSGMKARIIQHEYDHLEGVLFPDLLSAFKRQLLKGRLTRISKGKSEADYDMVFP